LIRSMDLAPVKARPRIQVMRRQKPHSAVEERDVLDAGMRVFGRLADNPRGDQSNCPSLRKGLVEGLH
jgi:hypothetical protein